MGVRSSVLAAVADSVTVDDSSSLGKRVVAVATVPESVSIERSVSDVSDVTIVS